MTDHELNKAIAEKLGYQVVQRNIKGITGRLNLNEQVKMKVNVLTDEQVCFKWWRWWSEWIDISVIMYACRPILLQMKVSRTNAKKFKTREITGDILASCHEIGDLTQMSKHNGQIQKSDSQL